MALTVALPAQGNTAWYAHYQDLDKAVRARVDDGQGIYLDDFTGTDDARLTLALAAQEATTNMPPIVLPARPLTFNTPRQLKPGYKIVGNGGLPSGQKNPELSGGNYVGTEITLGSSIGSGTSAWWHNNNGSTLYNVYMSGFAVQGDGGTSRHQFLDNTSGNLYACAFRDLSFNMMKAVFGDYSAGRKCLVTQVSWSGDWTINNCWNTPFFLGGSDCNISPDMMNIGVSQSSAQTGGLTTYFMVFDSCEVDLSGKIYISTMNGWRGVLISGNSNVNWSGGVVEGFKPTRTNGLLAGPGPGSQIKITGGSVNLFGTKVGQFMDDPDPSEHGAIDISSTSAASEVNMFGVECYGRNCGTANYVTHTNGRLYMAGVLRRPGETAYWTGRPTVATTATAGTGTFTFSCPDQSVTVV